MNTSRHKPQIQIRPGSSQDADAIALVLRESFNEYKSLYTDEGLAATTPGREQILSRMAEGPMWVALLNDEIVGAVSVVLKGEALYIRGMAVLPAARGNQIGELLLEQVANWAKAHNCKRL